MKCPVCHSALVVIEREGIEVDWCPDCRGLWFDQGELELLGEKAGRAIELRDLGRQPENSIEKGQRRCPRCPRRMERVILGAGREAPVEVDWCPRHGFWLDRGELGTILGRLEPERGTDEGLVLEFLGETFVGDALTAPPEGSQA